MDVVERDIDTLGRIVIPKPWRKHFGTHVILYQIGDEIRLKSKKPKKFLDLPKLELKLKAKLTDWHAVEKELMEVP